MRKPALILSLLIYLFFSSPVHAYRFVSWGDSRGSSGANTATITELSKQIRALSVQPVFTIFAGDLENSGFSSVTPGAWTTAINGGNNNGLFNITFPVRGNHDSSNTQGWVDYFNTKGNATAISGISNFDAYNEDLTYSFDYDNARIILLDTPGDITSNLSSQLTWLEGRLSDAQSNPKIVHIFLMSHGPIYPMANHVITPPSSLLTILDKYPKVSATFHGHEHIWSHVHMSPTDLSRYGLKNNSFEQFITGRSGAPTTSCTSSRVFSGGFCSTYEGFATVDVNGADVTVTYYQKGSTTPVKTFSYSNNKTSITTVPTGVKPTNTPIVNNTPCLLVGDTAKPTCDNKVDVLDYSYLSSKFNTNDVGADLDRSGKVTVLDYTILSNNFGKRLN